MFAGPLGEPPRYECGIENGQGRVHYREDNRPRLHRNIEYIERILRRGFLATSGQHTTTVDEQGRRQPFRRGSTRRTRGGFHIQPYDHGVPIPKLDNCGVVQPCPVRLDFSGVLKAGSSNCRESSHRYPTGGRIGVREVATELRAN